MITINVLPPAIKQSFDSYLLDRLLGMKMRVENKIKPLFQRKNRLQDIGKKKEFETLLIKFQDTYERKKIEEEQYKEKIKNAKKRSRTPDTGGVMRFRRFQSEGSNT